MDGATEAIDGIVAWTSIAEGSAQSIDFDQCPDDHHATRKKGGEAYPHLIEDDPRQDEEANEDVEEEFTPAVESEDRRVPAELGLDERLHWGEYVDEHVGEEHRQRDDRQCTPASGWLVTQ